MTNRDEDDVYRCEHKQAQAVGYIRDEMIAFSGKLSTGDNSSCGTLYKIEYYPHRYPRYLADLKCDNNTDDIVKSMRYLEYDNSDNTWKQRIKGDVVVGCKCRSSC